MPPASFMLQDMYAGYYVSHESITPLTVEPVGDLLARLVASDVELRIMPSLRLLRNALVHASLHFSMIRLRNSAPDLVT